VALPPRRWLRLVVVLWAMTAGPAVADQQFLDYRVARWTTAEGLPQNTINDIVALPNGELWLATFGGLARFDGARFEVMDIAREPGLASNRITSMVADGPDAAWFVTQEGHLGHLEAGRVRTILVPATPMPDAIGLVVARGRFYCQTAQGDIWTSDGTAPWRLLLRVPPAGPGSVDALANTRVGQGWASFGGALVPLTPEAGAVARRLPLETQGITGGTGRDLWVGLARGVGHVTDQGFTVLDIRPALQEATNVILHVSDRELWVGGGGTVSRLTAERDGSWARHDLPLDLPAGLFIRALAIDADGTVWIGTNGRGLYRANRQPTRLFGREAGLEAIAALATDGGNGAWVSGTCTGVYHIDEDGTVETIHGESSPVAAEPGSCEHGFAAAEDGALWVRWRAHVYRVQRTAPHVRRWPVTLPAELGPVVPAPDGTLWIVSRNGDVRRVSATDVLEQLTLPAPLISAVLGPDGSLWVGGSGEVFQIAAGKGEVRRLGAREGLPRGSVRDVLADADGTLWIATYGGGLGRLRNGRITTLTVDAGLPDNSISRVLDDGRGRLWLSSNRGIAVIDRSDVDRIAAGTHRALMPVVLGAERGVPEANFGLPAGFADAQGRLWFGTIDGVVRIDASRFPFNARPPVVRVDAVRADDVALPLGSRVEVPAGTARVRFTFGAAALLFPERTRFRVRIEGLDRDWVDVGAQRSATFTPAGPGQYRFLLQARNEDGIWNTTPAVVALEVLPTWWQTTAARVAGLAGLILLTSGLYRQRVSVLERRHAERVRALEDRRGAEEQATALRTQLQHVSRVALAGELAASLAHEVNQPLTAIVANAEAGQHLLGTGASGHDEVAEMLNDIVVQGLRASEVIGGLREFLRDGHPAPAPVNLTQLVHEMLPLVRREFEEHAVQTSLRLDETLPTVEGRRVQLGQILVNLLLNACEALERQDGPRLVTVTTRAREDRVELTVSDNGPGLSPSVADRVFEPFVSSKPQGMGMGLAICRSIAESHRGRLVAEPAVGGGLSMTLSLPATRP